jgi:hypothetical protein
MPAARITLAHFSVSSAMSLPKSAGTGKNRTTQIAEPKNRGEHDLRLPANEISERGRHAAIGHVLHV